MPYILEELKADPELRREQFWRDVGSLTFEIQQLLLTYLLLVQEEDGSYHYADLANCLSALDGAKADFIRRVLNPYEETKQAQNGDVWEELWQS